MITFPCAKINLGLNVVAKRSDGYHDIETIFYPIPFTDVLEVKSMGDKFPSEIGCDLKVTGNIIACNDNDNLVVKAYQLLAEDHRMPRIYAHLYKRIPAQAGLGGGSSDGAFMIRLLCERNRLNIGNTEMEHYAARLGADCTFFIMAAPSFATGIGNQLIPTDASKGNLNGYFILIIKPKVMVSTCDAYAKITPHQPQKSCRTIVNQPINTWKDELINDFEEPVFAQYPELAAIKEKLYQSGAVYVQMSGSGSAIYGIFRKDPASLKVVFKEDFIWSGKIYG